MNNITSEMSSQELKMSRILPGFCVLLLISLTSAYAARTRTLDSIGELKLCVTQSNILELLHWFANKLNIENYNDIQLTFEPELEYGSHHYGNFDGLLDDCPWGYKYYTVGNIHRDSLEQLPAYVRNARWGTIGWGRARIIFRARERNGRWTIQRVYITQHIGTSVLDGTEYDPEHTYEITTNLLRQFRARSISEIQRGVTDSQRSNFVNSSVFQQVSSSSNQNSYVPQYNPRPAAPRSSFGYTSTHSQGSYYSNQNYRPQYNTRSADEDDVLGQFCIALALFFVVLLIFLVKQ